MDQPTAARTLTEMAPLVGTWILEATGPGGEPWPGKATATIEWHESGAHLVERTSMDVPGAPDATKIMGCDGANGTYYQLYSDDRGVCRVYEMSIGMASGGYGAPVGPSHSASSAHSRTAATRSSGRWEKAHDGQTYETDFHLIYRRDT